MGKGYILSGLKDGDWKKLLILEKERRGMDRDELIFLGTADIAEFMWCQRKSVLRNKRSELHYFMSYLEDRIRYSQQLGRLEELPTRKEELLDIGNDITLLDIELLLRKKEKPKHRLPMYKRIKLLDFMLNKIRVSDSSRGVQAHNIVAEPYRTIRWNFQWRKYVIVGIPDGITDQFVYEFKSTRNEFLRRAVKPVAFAQANLYGYFFRRSMRRIQILNMADKNVRTWFIPVNCKKAVNLLRTFDEFLRLENKQSRKRPIFKKRWKCKCCEFRKECERCLRGSTWK